MRIGALCTHTQLEKSEEVSKHLPLVAEAVAHIAHPAIRNRGTLGGSLALADPAAELPACALALDAVLIVASRTGERRVAAADFFKGLFETDLKPNEILVGVEFPKADKSVFLELTRRQGDYAIVGLAATVKGTERRLAFFGIGGKPILLKPKSLEEAKAALPTPAADLYHSPVHQAAPGESAARARMEQTLTTTMTVNGAQVTRSVAPRQHLVDFLREELGLTGSHLGCEHGVCGACTIRVDGEIVRGCLMLAVQANGCRVDTIEGLSDSKELEKLQAAFHRRNALQCGFCTPGMLMAAQDLDPQQQESDPRRNPRAYLGQLLPLHGLPGHRRRDRGSDQWVRPSFRSTRRAPRSTRATSARACRGRTRSACCRGAARSPTTCASRASRTWRSSAARTRMPRIKKLDFSKAIKQPGVIGGLRRPRGRRVLHAVGRGARAPEGHQVAAAARDRDRARLLAGRSRCAAVVAESRTQAEDAVQLIEAEWEELPVVVDMEDSLKEIRESSIRSSGDNICFKREHRHRRRRRGLRQGRRGGRGHVPFRPPHRRVPRRPRHPRRLQRRASIRSPCTTRRRRRT